MCSTAPEAFPMTPGGSGLMKGIISTLWSGLVHRLGCGGWLPRDRLLGEFRGIFRGNYFA